MCRMFATVGGAPTMDELQAFRGLCQTGCGGPHGDGWGMVGFADAGPEWVAKSTRPAQSDQAFGPAAHAATRFPTVLAHLRKASSGVLSLDNTHPFVQGRFAFAHNGTVREPYVEKLAPGSGMNDSRVLFQRTLALARDPLEGLRAAVREVKDGGFAYSSITLLMTDGATLWAARDVRERPDEYAMLWKRDGPRTLFCQERIGPGSWNEIPNGSVAVAGPRGVEVERL